MCRRSGSRRAAFGSGDVAVPDHPTRVPPLPQALGELGSDVAAAEIIDVLGDARELGGGSDADQRHLGLTALDAHRVAPVAAVKALR